MKRTVSETKIGETQIRYRTRIEDEESAPGSEDARVMQYHFLKSLADQQVLLACGLNNFQQLKMYHSGTRWIVEAEAVIDIPVA